MAIVRYEPFGLLNTRPSFDALFDRLFEDALGWGRPGASARRSSVAANLYETQESYWVELPLPGVKPDDVEVTVQENLLTIGAKRTWELPEGAQPIWQGFGSGEWKQSFTLPGEVNPDQVQATLEHGVLRLQLAKAEHIRPRTVRVQGLGGATTTPTIEGKAGEKPKGSSK